MSDGHLCEAEAPTEAEAETLSSETRLRERKGKVFMYLEFFSPSVTAYAVPPPSSEGGIFHSEFIIPN